MPKSACHLDGSKGHCRNRDFAVPRRRTFTVFFILLAILIIGAPVFAGPLRISIPAEVSVQTDILVLADLLPRNVPRELKNIAANVGLGSAPQIGSLRHLSREFISSILDEVELPSSSFAVPETVVIHRTARPISRDEVAAAVLSALRRNPALPSIDISSLAVDAFVDVPDSDPQLEVIQTTLDAPLVRLRFRLAAKASPVATPFFATARLAPDSITTIPRTAITRSIARRALDPAVAPLFVLTGRAAHLHVHSANSDMQLVVKPLQRGRLGETIRVRLVGSIKTLQGRVIAPGELDATF
jgi:hypothetical protein